MLPLTNNLIKIVGLQDILDPIDLSFKDRNFEEVYDILYQKQEYADIRQEIEQRVYSYFTNFSIPKGPTIYDYLLLSLRDKDLIATFNWDPLLVQAYRRNVNIDLPHLVFLHGNVTVGYCKDDRFKGNIFSFCPHCSKKLAPTPLLYPITEKNYAEDDFISAEWKTLQNYLENAFMITIFGYSSPSSDYEAKKMLEKAWGDPKDRKMEEIEIIDIKTEEELRNLWKDFIFSHHWKPHLNFLESWIARHPRRTYEAYFSQEFEAKFIPDNPVPKFNDLDILRNWFADLIQVELTHKEKMFNDLSPVLIELYEIIEDHAKNIKASIPNSFQKILHIIDLIQTKKYREIPSLLRFINQLELESWGNQMEISKKQRITKIFSDLGFPDLKDKKR